MIMEEQIDYDIDGRLSYPDDESRYYIYIGTDRRIIKIQEYKHWYTPVREFKFFTFDGKINPKVFINPHEYTLDKDEIVQKPNCSFQVLQQCKEEALEVIIWERFENFIFNYTRMYAKNFIEMLSDIYILDEIKDYINNNKTGQLLNNLYLMNENNYSLEDIVNKEILKIEDKKNILMFIDTQRHNLKKLISEKKYEEALSYIKKTHASW
jgi:hypothetical protein